MSSFPAFDPAQADPQFCDFANDRSLVYSIPVKQGFDVIEGWIGRKTIVILGGNAHLKGTLVAIQKALY